MGFAIYGYNEVIAQKSYTLRHEIESAPRSLISDTILFDVSLGFLLLLVFSYEIYREVDLTRRRMRSNGDQTVRNQSE